MKSKTERTRLTLTEDEKEKLEKILQSENMSQKELLRATILLKYSQGWSLAEIQRKVGLSRPTIYKCIDRALAGNVLEGINPKPSPNARPEIDREAKEWILSIAATLPSEHGLSTDQWSLSKLTEVVQKKSGPAGFPRLAKVPKMTVWRILDAANVKLRPEDDSLGGISIFGPLVEVLVFCQELPFQPDGSSAIQKRKKNTSQKIEKDLPKDSLTVLAALDLHTGKIFASMADPLCDRSLSNLMQSLDRHYPPSALIRLIIDNRSLRLSRNDIPYLSKNPKRFDFLNTSWFSLLETTFARIARSFLSQIPARSKEEIQDIFLQKINEWNDFPDTGLPGKV